MSESKRAQFRPARFFDWQAHWRYLFVCRSTQISHLQSMHTPSVAQAPLVSIYRATYAVQQSPQKRSSGAWVLLFNQFQACLTGILT